MIGEKLGPFRIDAKLGSSAMGVVYRAVHEPTGQVVALKVVAGEVASRGNAAERFERESDILKQFKHPNIVQHVGTGFSKSRELRFYAMEYVPGVTLEQVLSDRDKMPWQEVVDLGIQMCDALQYAHERGVVHRDLKPSNLMISEKGELKLTDFGIAKDLDRTALTADGRTLGTAAYMAPEQIRGTPEVSHKTDLYALGCVLFQMLTGRAPFEGKSALQLMHKHLQDPPPRPSAFGAEVPRALDKLVVELMAKARDDRPWDAQAVAQTLRGIQEAQFRGEKVSLVHDDLPANPSRLGAEAAAVTKATTVAGTGAATSGRGTKSRKAAGKRDGRRAAYSGDIRGLLEYAAMVLALIGLGGFIVYQFWPASEGYLYKKAAQYMASAERADRLRAREKYMAQLDRRFPQHAHQAELRQWRDQLLLEDIERRAKFLETPALASLTNINLDVERSYAEVARSVRDDLDNYRDLEALFRWQGLSKTLETEAESNEQIRAWHLLVTQRAETLDGEIKRRLAGFMSAMQRFSAAQLTGNVPEVNRIGREILDQFGRYQSLERPIALLRANLVDQPTTEPIEEAPAIAPPALAQPAAPAATERP